ncbi:hypothetical protein BS47DRAFT_1079051 [Hydnum rufescens UP504]|uniref:Uncharacterized protein n=1 Tax=Hydnum rufescens UP504 TaxID=1448309 RepID=A0A9P6B8F3_9AGAM|nr:hypothetical protein BS47DRAFT_1079051 [Hydnum rufescens UP504]
MKFSKAIPAIAWAVAQRVDATPVLGYPLSPNPSGNGLAMRSTYTGSDSWQASSSHPTRARDHARNPWHLPHPHNHSHHHRPPTHANAHPNRLDRPHSPSTNLNVVGSNGVEIDIVPGGWTNPTAHPGPKIPTAESHPIATPSSDGVGIEPPSHDGWRDATMSWYDGKVLQDPPVITGQRGQVAAKLPIISQQIHRSLLPWSGTIDTPHAMIL